MHIRGATPDDAHVVLTWLNKKEIWLVDNPNPHKTKTYQQFAPQWQDLLDNHAVWMLVVGEQIVGQVGWISESPDRAEFFITIGEGSARGKGYGQLGMNWLEQQAAKVGLSCLVGKVLGNNVHAQGFFRHLGYELAGALENRIERNGDVYPLYFFEKRLG
jgi:RimJ/RimL family protein N-acetyltransferase